MWLNGKFPSYSKNSSWDVFVTVPNEGGVLEALNNLGSSDTRSVADVKPLELFVIQLYCCRHKIPPNNHDLAALKWHMFPKQQLDSQRVDSPTREALRQKVLRAHFAALQCKSSYLPSSLLPDPGDYGWKYDSTNSL